MIWAFENDTSAVIKKLAQKSIHFDKKKNLFCLSAIIVAVAMIMMSLLTVQNIIQQNQTEIKDLHQGIFFHVTLDSKEKILSEENVKNVGLSYNIKTVQENSKNLSLIYYDNTMFHFIPNFNGKYPEKSNEIAVTDTFFTSENNPPEINTIIPLNIDGTLKDYTIVGIFHDENTSAYPVFVSFSKFQELKGNDLLNGYVWIENADTFTKDEATEILSQISENTGLNDWTVSNYYDANANLSFNHYAVYGVVAAILFLSASLVIYSIFYISVGHKVTEFGQLRTIGASKKQIYKMVLKQGYILGFPGILIGSMIGTMISYYLQPKGWSVSAFILSLLGSCLFGILLVYISIRKPAKIAANTSPISALKNQIETITYHKHKNHHISPAYLAKISFFRNRNKSLLTILSMGLCGVIFFLSASYQSSFNAKSMARYWDMRYGDFKISVDLEDNSKDINTLLQREYFSDYVKRIENMEEIINIFSYSALPVEFSTDNNIYDNTLLLGYNEKDIDFLNSSTLSGSITDETELIISDPNRIYDVYHWDPQIGDFVSLSFQHSNGTIITKDFKISAITSNGDGMGGYIFRMPEKMMKELAGYDCTYAIEIQEKPESYEIVEQKLKGFISGNNDVYLQTIQDVITEHQSANSTGFALAYAISAVLWIFAAINQINLTITNFLAQKQEMGILKSIGMTNKQLKQSFALEGLFNTLISILITVVFGVPGGYLIGICLKNSGMSRGFVFPITSFILFVVGMLILESSMILLLIHSWKNQSIIEAIGNS
ncbi:MAG TPA: ABC transporter permease [Candidatus Merdenecus merdavium]|nr:ABC transporter permease [Candidatus Merdenecus merdavium]